MRQRIVQGISFAVLSVAACAGPSSQAIVPRNICELSSAITSESNTGDGSAVLVQNAVAADRSLPQGEVRGCVVEARTGAAIVHIAVRKGWPVEERANHDSLMRRIRQMANDTVTQIIGSSGMSMPPDIGALTDSAGHFRLTGLPLGQTVLRVSRPGFYDDSVVFKAKSGALVRLAMKADSTPLGRIRIRP